jgi:hypothetical protein
VPRQEAESARGRKVKVGFEVKNIKETARALEGKGIRFEWFHEDFMTFAYFKDAGGNVLYLAEKK